MTPARATARIHVSAQLLPDVGDQRGSRSRRGPQQRREADADERGQVGAREPAASADRRYSAGSRASLRGRPAHRAAATRRSASDPAPALGVARRSAPAKSPRASSISPICASDCGVAGIQRDGAAVSARARVAVTLLALDAAQLAVQERAVGRGLRCAWCRRRGGLVQLSDRAACARGAHGSAGRRGTAARRRAAAGRPARDRRPAPPRTPPCASAGRGSSASSACPRPTSAGTYSAARRSARDRNAAAPPSASLARELDVPGGRFGRIEPGRRLAAPPTLPGRRCAGRRPEETRHARLGRRAAGFAGERRAARRAAMKSGYAAPRRPAAGRFAARTPTASRRARPPRGRRARMRGNFTSAAGRCDRASRRGTSATIDTQSVARLVRRRTRRVPVQRARCARGPRLGRGRTSSVTRRTSSASRDAIVSTSSSTPSPSSAEMHSAGGSAPAAAAARRASGDRTCCRPRERAPRRRRPRRAPGCTASTRRSRSAAAASMTCSTRSASATSSSVARNAATSACGSRSMKPTVSRHEQLPAVGQPHLPHQRIERDEQRVGGLGARPASAR